MSRFKPRVVIIGAGFAGVNLAKTLARAPVETLLIDKRNYHTFQPLLYQVATAGLEPESIAHSVRGMFHAIHNCEFLLGEVTQVDKGNKWIHLADGSRVSYDYLVIAVGAVTTFFGIEGAAENAFTLKSVHDAINIRSHVLKMFEMVNADPDLIEQGFLNFVIVGGGPTGVEVAGSMIELFNKVLRKDFKRLDFSQVNLYMVESSDYLLDAFKQPLQEFALHKLKKWGIEIKLGRKVTKVEGHKVLLSDQTYINTHTLIWTAGIRANPLADVIGLPQGRAGRLITDPDLSVPGYPDIFVAGDVAGSADENGNYHPQLAPNAIQGAKHIARQILLKMRGQQTTPYRYIDKGIMATIGRNAAVTQLNNRVYMRGFLAWVVWLFLHLMYLVGFRNRLQVFLDWFWNYITYDRSARMIFNEEIRPGDKPLKW